MTIYDDKYWRQKERERRIGEWCIKAENISAKMCTMHAAKNLTKNQQLTLALRLKRRSIPYQIERYWSQQPSTKTIEREVKNLRKSISMIAKFAAGIEAAEEKQRTNLTNEEWHKLSTAFAIGKAAQQWELATRDEYAKSLLAWHSSGKISSKPKNKLESHIDDPAVIDNDVLLPYADTMVYRWLSQAIFIKEILKVLDKNIENGSDYAPLDGPTPERVLAGIWAPRLFELTYPGVEFGRRNIDDGYENAAGYTFVTMAVEAVTGKTLAPNTIRAYMSTTEGSGY